jgi:hypothetical protein
LSLDEFKKSGRGVIRTLIKDYIPEVARALEKFACMDN